MATGLFERSNLSVTLYFRTSLNASVKTHKYDKRITGGSVVFSHEINFFLNKYEGKDE